MNPAEWHLNVVHAPGMAALFGWLLLIFGVLAKNRDYQRAALWLFVAAGLTAIPAYLSGAPAMEYLKTLMPTMQTEAAELHAELAMLALGASALLGLFAAGILFWARRGEGLRRWMLTVALVAGFLASGMMWYTSHAGAKIRHPEIRRNA